MRPQQGGPPLGLVPVLQAVLDDIISVRVARQLQRVLVHLRQIRLRVSAWCSSLLHCQCQQLSLVAH